MLGLLTVFLSSCTGPPKTHLVSDASILKVGQSQTDVLKLFGPPYASQTNAKGQEEWYYYEVNKHFWQRIPLLGKYLGGEKIEALQIIFESRKVIKVQYYVVPGS
ncbi:MULTISPECIES: hypothetical protein [Dissulfurimicrobium]|uniref:hypothetical protein n=1 Tax=Dissulfurimicrobium TaxID=1769732 RepID=UPI003C74E336